jgi:muramoyltetrapeptide carboxypeptidase
MSVLYVATEAHPCAPRTNTSMRFPPPLRSGARVALIAPAGPVRGSHDVERALNSVRRMSWEPVLGAHVGERDGYLAGSDAHRAADFNRFAADDSIDALWCVRGGYGAMRLLDAIDYDVWRRRPKPLIGYSDITALHAAIGRRADIVTFHGPTAREEMSDFSADSLARALTLGTDPCGLAAEARTLASGRARGRLAGGNLALLAALCGTPFAPSFEDTILVLEDVGEAVYRIDRMLTQLRLSGALSGVMAIACGCFTEVPNDSTNEQCSIDRVLQETADRLGVPCIAGIPMGHCTAQWTIPLGAMAELDADACTLTVEQRAD